MVINIQNSYIQTFESNVRHLAQQGEALLRAKVSEKSTNGEKHNWDKLAPTAAVQKVAKRVATPYQDGNWTRRVSTPQTWHWADSYEEQDIVQMLIDPSSALTVNGAAAMKRATDDIIINQATIASLNGDATTTALPAGQIIGTGAAEITFDNILNINQIFMTNNIDMDVPRCLAIGPKQVRSLMRTVEVTSSDYQNMKALAGNGYLPNFLGFDWIVSNRLVVPAANQLNCLAFTPYAMGLQVNSDIKTNVAQDPSMSFLYAVYMQFTMGAVRVEDEHMVRLHVSNLGDAP